MVIDMISVEMAQLVNTNRVGRATSALRAEFQLLSSSINSRNSQIGRMNVFP
jgi:hypothetical protein